LRYNTSGQRFLEPADSINKARVTTALISGGAIYTGFSAGFYYAWYRNYSQSHFHFFNDLHEWNQMDKAGHIHSAYFQGLIPYTAMRWAGVSEQKSILTGIVTGTLFQTSLEIMDGFSSKWGFSISDMAANLTGTSIFAFQQYYWHQQRIVFKVSSLPVSYHHEPIYSTDGLAVTTLADRAQDLYGNGIFERFLKDYNAQAYWASFDIHAMLHEGNQWPSWLNIALGYGANNMYGGFDNTWQENGHTFTLDNRIYPRYRQFFIGIDLNLPGLKPKSPFLKTVFSTLNIFRIPAPALEINTRGEVVFHLFR
jgi:hypothetical protein